MKKTTSWHTLVSPTAATKGARVMSHASIRDIALCAGSCSHDFDRDNLPQKVRFDWRFRTTPQLAPEHDTLSVYVSFELKVAEVTEETRKKPANANIRADFCARYMISLKQKFSPGEIQAFADANALFNCWPYLREFVQDVFGRFDLPRIILPLLRISAAPKRQSKRQSVSRKTSARKKHSRTTR